MLCNYYLISAGSLQWATTSASGVRLSVVLLYLPPLQGCYILKQWIQGRKIVLNSVWQIYLEASGCLQ